MGPGAGSRAREPGVTREEPLDHAAEQGRLKGSMRIGGLPVIRWRRIF